jgi:hypothetical protein
LKHYNQSDNDNILFVPHAFCFTGKSGTVEATALLRDNLKALPEMPSLIIVDTLNRNFGSASENSDEDMTSFIRSCDHLRTETGAAVLVIHHIGKNVLAKERGHSSLRGACDTVLLVQEQADRLSVIVQCDKQKDSMPFKEYELRKHLVGSSLIFQEPDELTRSWSQLTDAQKSGLRTLVKNVGTKPFTYSECNILFTANDIATSPRTISGALKAYQEFSFVEHEKKFGTYTLTARAKCAEYKV